MRGYGNFGMLPERAVRRHGLGARHIQRREGRPAFAALDVTRTEPMPADSPLWQHPKIAITPHDSSDTPGTVTGADDTFLANLALYLAGKPMKHLVDPAAFAAGPSA